MQDGFIKVCSATVPIKVADIQFNTSSIINGIVEACEKQAEIVVFPELCITSSTCGDLFLQDVLLSAAENAVREIIDYTNGNKIVAVVGCPVRVGDDVYNCAVVISNGKALGVVPKTAHMGGVFTDYQGANLQICFAGKNVPFGTKLIFKSTNCSLFSFACEIGEDMHLPISPSVLCTQNGANIIVNLSASCEVVGKGEIIRKTIEVQSRKLVCAYILSEAGDGESTTDCVYSGVNYVAELGDVLAETSPFKNALLYSELDLEKICFERRKNSFKFNKKQQDGYEIINFECRNLEVELTRDFPQTPFVPSDKISSAERTEHILNIQAKALEKRLNHTNAKSVVIGVSGGLDSTLAMLVIARAFDGLNKSRKDVIAVTMPGFGTTGRTYNNAVKLIELLGFSFKEISIKDSVLQHFKDIGHPLDVIDVTYENAQARMRTLILMDVANQNGGLVIGTGDLSELALGWATYNGDQMSMYGVNASVPKTLVKEIVRRYANTIGGEIANVLNDVVCTDISPELLPPDKSGKIEQKTQDLVGPYVLHDFFLYYFIRWGYSPTKIKRVALYAFKSQFDEQTIDSWLKVFFKRFFAQQFKRSCMPDGVKVGCVSLSPRGAFNMPSDATSCIWLNNL